MTPRILHVGLSGWSSSDPATRHIGWGAPGPNFWRGWCEHNAYSQRKADPMQSVFVWNPFGCLANEPMQLTQATAARRAGLTWLFEDFDTFHALAHNGGEVGFYVGCGVGDKILSRYQSDRTRLQCIRDATAPFTTGCYAIGIDAASGLPATSLTYQEMCRWQDRGIRVYAEALPPESSEHLHRFPAFATRWFMEHPDRPTWGVTENVPEVIYFTVDAPLTRADIDAAHARGWSIAGSVPVDLANEDRDL